MVAIEKAMDGKRPWNRAKYTTLESFLRSVIDSDISHLVESLDNSAFRRLSGPSASDETAKAYQIASTDGDPLTIVIDRDSQARFRDAAMRELQGEEFLTQLFQCMVNEITEPGEIAKVTGKTVDYVNNEKKKLRRRLEKLNTRIKPQKTRTGR